MDVKKVIIHELTKEQGKTDANEFIADNLLPLNEKTIELVEKLDKSFKKDFINYAIFNEEGENDFPSYFKKYYESPHTENDFLIYTRSTLLDLKKIIQGVIFAKGGYLVYAEYNINNTNYTSVYLIRDETGLLFKKSNERKAFTIDTISYLNTNKLAMGCRINLDKFKNADGRYLSMIKNNQADISDYFTKWISILQKESSTEFTRTLYSLINEVTLPKKNDSDEDYTIDEFRKKVYDYINERPSKVVNIPEMSNYFYGNFEYLTDFAYENNYEIDSEFKVDGRSLKRFTTLDVLADGIKLRFSRGDLSLNKIRLSEDNPDMIIIESKKFAQKFKKECSEEN